MSKKFTYRWNAAIGGRIQGTCYTKKAANELLDAIESGEIELRGQPIGKRRQVFPFRVYYEPCGQCGVICLHFQDGVCEDCYIKIRGRSVTPDIPGALVFWRVVEHDIFGSTTTPNRYFAKLDQAESYYDQAIKPESRLQVRRFDYWLQKIEIPPNANPLDLLNGEPKILRRITIKCTRESQIHSLEN
jgi:hypothetical protein